jgi:hypothetical protein
MVHLSNIKLDCVLMAECKNGAQIAGKHTTYSTVVNKVTVRFILLLAWIYKLESKAIDFVLAIRQAELDVNIWMYLPIGFQVDTENESKCYILKLNKSLHGLKQASLNCLKKLEQGLILINHGFHPSAINPCLYFKKRMIMMTVSLPAIQ